MEYLSNSLKKQPQVAPGSGSLARTSFESTTSGFSQFPVWSVGARDSRAGGGTGSSGGRSGASSFSVQLPEPSSFLQRFKKQPSTTADQAAFTGGSVVVGVFQFR